MRKFILVLIVLSCVSAKSYCQGTKDSLLRDINIALAEGLEAKELLEVAVMELQVCDSTVDKLVEIKKNLEKQNKLYTQNFNIVDGQKTKAVKALGDCKEELFNSELNVEKQKKRKRFWRTVVIVETSLLTVVGLLVFL